MMVDDFRVETDSIGSIKVSNKYYFGAQTQRSLENFVISNQLMPICVIHALAKIKYCAASVNCNFGMLSKNFADVIKVSAKRVFNGELNDQFPLVVWQTGSGTQTNMNVNEVIASVANEILTKKRSVKEPIHPNDHVNMCQSSNDSFPTAMHIATVLFANQKLIPSLTKLKLSLVNKSKKWNNIFKIGRTHLQDATPISLAQEFSAYAAQVEYSIKRIKSSLSGLYYIAQGATAVGTGINAYPGFSEEFARELSSLTGYEFKSALNKFEAISAHDQLVEFSGSLNTLAASLTKIANDIRLLASGPRCGIAEIVLPQNEPGSSIMPGKVNPTQCEALTMVCAQVMGNHVAVTIGGAHGHLQLNVFKPLIIQNVIHSMELLSDAVKSFTEKCIDGIEPDVERINELVGKSLMLVTALTPAIGYDKAAYVAKVAHKSGKTLRDVVIEENIMTADEFDKRMLIQDMVHL